MLQVSIVCKTLLLTVCRWCATVARRNVAVFVQCTRWLVASHKRWLALVAALRVCSLLRNAVNGPLFVAAAQRLAAAARRGSFQHRQALAHRFCTPQRSLCVQRYCGIWTRLLASLILQYHSTPGASRSVPGFMGDDGGRRQGRTQGI